LQDEINATVTSELEGEERKGFMFLPLKLTILIAFK